MERDVWKTRTRNVCSTWIIKCRIRREFDIRESRHGNIETTNIQKYNSLPNLLTSKTIFCTEKEKSVVPLLASLVILPSRNQRNYNDHAYEWGTRWRRYHEPPSLQAWRKALLTMEDRSDSVLSRHVALGIACLDSRKYAVGIRSQKKKRKNEKRMRRVIVCVGLVVRALVATKNERTNERVKERKRESASEWRK